MENNNEKQLEEFQKDTNKYIKKFITKNGERIIRIKLKSITKDFGKNKLRN